MDNAILIQVTNEKALGILHELEELHLIKVLNDKVEIGRTKLSAKYRGILTQKQGSKLDEHINHLRNEWKNI